MVGLSRGGAATLLLSPADFADPASSDPAEGGGVQEEGVLLLLGGDHLPPAGRPGAAGLGLRPHQRQRLPG